MFDSSLLHIAARHPLRRFWQSARHFWQGPTARLAWGLIAALVVITVLQLLVQYRLNIWNRDFFNALEFRDGARSGTRRIFSRCSPRSASASP